MGLQEEIDEKRKEIYTNKYSISIGELLHLYADEELDVHPEYQRFLRWTDQQKTDLIESIVLGIPIPPIFVAQRADGVWDIIDGLQRMGTILQFIGVKRDEKGRRLQPLVLRATKALPSLEGMKWENLDDPTDEKVFSKAQQLLIKRSSLDITIVLKESDEQSKYELFMRLNTGGSLASPQEVRNCLLISINRDFFKWMESLREDRDFRETTALTDRKENEQYAMELVLRFVTLRNLPEERLSGLGLIGDFLTDRMIDLARANSLDYDREANAFQSTFRLLNQALRDDAFRKWDGTRFTGGFSISAFEGVALGIGHNVDKEGFNGDQLPEKVKALWEAPEFRQWTGVGKPAGSRIPRTVTIGRNHFKP
ncbi:hypothetical protein OJF2_46890 [Aquisphaera giovannonii]|uniref:GmrSD restriction endonucleases N-terminal domain-containing protein n=1 Tax=Aquisphaera giovannonii TaxID=406548 RepID=A0A5B9W7L9_9BACT|nr:DUF262 domain-containing protein [Aquisphaera giovannonii]QEH36129.1 hypothetical protein OJF2_46890 [Aquisphaera giovannonii]